MVTVTVLDDVAPTTVLEKVKLVGVKVSGAIPVPVIFTTCGLGVAPSLKVNAPVIAATTLGLKVTFTVQLLFTASELGQLLVSEKSPLATIELIGKAPDPVLVRVTDLAALVVPAARLPKAKVFGLMLATGVPPPELNNT